MLQAIQQYDIIEKIGEGGMGVVYKALHRTLERLVAIKRLAPHLSKNQNMLDRFLKEARLQAKLSHANVVNIFDLLEWEGDVYLVMEFVSGQSVREMIETSGHLGIRDSLHIAGGVLAGLAFMHANNIVHRDIKPSNIIVSQSGQVKVTDFGIARLMEGDTGLTRFGAGVGTLKYMAPELLKSGEVSFSVDIYSMGVTLYEMLGGSPPFSGSTDLEVMLGHIEKVPPPLTLPEDEAGLACRDMVMKALSKLPGDRFGSAGEFLAEVRRVLVLAGGDIPLPGHLAVGGHPTGHTKVGDSGPATRTDARTGAAPVGGTTVSGTAHSAPLDATMIGDAPLPGAKPERSPEPQSGEKPEQGPSPESAQSPARGQAKGKGKGLIAGLAAAAVLAVAGFLFLGGKGPEKTSSMEESRPQAQQAATSPPPAQEAAAPATPAVPETPSAQQTQALPQAAPDNGQGNSQGTPSPADSPAQAPAPGADTAPAPASAPAKADAVPTQQPSGGDAPKVETQPQPADAPKVLYTQSQLVRLRGEPNPSASILGSLELNTRLDVTGMEGDWAKVTTPQGVTGYVAMSQVAEEPAKTPVQAAPKPAAKPQSQGQGHGKKSTTGGDKGWRIVK